MTIMDDERTLPECLAEFCEDKLRLLCLLAAIFLLIFGG